MTPLSLHPVLVHPFSVSFLNLDSNPNHSLMVPGAHGSIWNRAFEDVMVLRELAFYSQRPEPPMQPVLDFTDLLPFLSYWNWPTLY